MSRAAEGGIATDAGLAYHPMAIAIASGDGLYGADGQPMMKIVPGYPLLLAGAMYFVGSTERAVTLVQTTAGALVVGLVFLLTASLVSIGAGHVAALLALFHPDLVAYSLFSLSDGPYLVLFLVACLTMLSLLRRASLGLAILLGFVLGLGVLVREASVVLLPVWTVALLFPVYATAPAAPRRLAIAAAVAVASLAVLTPWWVRNYRAVHEFVPLTSKGGVSIYRATLLRPYPWTDPRNKQVTLDEETLRREAAVRKEASQTRGIRDRDRVYLRAAWDNVVRDPLAQIFYVGRKFRFLWSSNIGPRHASRIGFPVLLWTIAAAHYLLLVCGLTGIWLCRGRPGMFTALVLPLIALTLLYVLVGSFEPRYHLPAIPALLLGAAALIVRIAPRLTARHGSRISV